MKLGELGVGIRIEFFNLQRSRYDVKGNGPKKGNQEEAAEDEGREAQ
jgi:hypothetical protein